MAIPELIQGAAEAARRAAEAAARATAEVARHATETQRVQAASPQERRAGEPRSVRSAAAVLSSEGAQERHRTVTSNLEQAESPAPQLFSFRGGLEVASTTARVAPDGPAEAPTQEPSQGESLTREIEATRREMEAELERRREHLEELRQQRPDGGLEEWFKDVLPGVDSESESLDAQIAAEEQAIGRLEALLEDPDRQFLKVDVGGDGRIVEVLGDLREADHVAIHVPGMDTDIDDYTAATHGDARSLYNEMQRQAPGEDVASIAFLDYNPPDNNFGGWFGSAGEAAATEGAEALDSWVDRLHEDGFSADQLTVVAHSYGSTTAGIALEHEDLQVGRLAVVGSPGLGDGVDDISDLGRQEVAVYAGKSEGVAFPGGDGDPITWLPAHGEDPADDGFGAIRFSTGDSRGHSQYFQGESLRNLALIAVGREPTLQ